MRTIAFLMANHNRFHQLILEGACRAAYGLNAALWPVIAGSSELDAWIEDDACAPPRIQELEVALVNGDRSANVAEGRKRAAPGSPLKRSRLRDCEAMG